MPAQHRPGASSSERHHLREGTYDAHVRMRGVAVITAVILARTTACCRCRRARGWSKPSDDSSRWPTRIHQFRCARAGWFPSPAHRADTVLGLGTARHGLGTPHHAYEGTGEDGCESQCRAGPACGRQALPLGFEDRRCERALHQDRADQWPGPLCLRTTHRSYPLLQEPPVGAPGAGPTLPVALSWRLGGGARVGSAHAPRCS
jgi:hypothetical protein